MNHCEPCTNTPNAALDCAGMLASACAAYNALMIGQEVISVGFGEQRVQYSQKNKAELLAHIQRLHAACPSQASAAILGVGMAGVASVGFGRATRGRCGC